MVLFDWDPNKNLINKFKHNISFEEAILAFYDDDAIIFDDPKHSIGEERFLIIGRTEDRTIIVSHCYMSDDETIRIISAM